MKYRVVVVATILVAVFVARGAYAQVVECPRPPSAATWLPKDRASSTSESLSRFLSVLDLRGQLPLGEAEIEASYGDRLDELLIKLQYLTLQCQMTALDSQLSIAERRRMIRRRFLEDIVAAASYKSAVYRFQLLATAEAADGRSPRLDAAVQDAVQEVERAIERSPREDWRKTWFKSPADRQDGTEGWSVIVASPRNERSGWTALRSYQEKWPDVHFELYSPFYDDNSYYALVAGRGLTQASAKRLLAQVSNLGMPSDSYLWLTPSHDDEALPRPRQ